MSLCPEEGEGCFKLSTGKGCFEWFPEYDVPGRDSGYWIILLYGLPLASSF